MLPLYGGGFLVALSQLTAFYYVTAALLHFVLPAWLPVKGVQVQERTPGDVSRDAFNSLGANASYMQADVATVLVQMWRAMNGAANSGTFKYCHAILSIACLTRNHQLR